MLNGRQLMAAAGLVLAIAACERTITGPPVYVDRPRTDTLLVVRWDTLVTVRPETTFTQLLGRTDTLIVDRPVIVVRVDSLRIITHDTVVVRDTVRHTDTLTKVDTVTVVRRDTVVVVKPETVYVHRGPAELPRLTVDTRMPDMPMNGDTTYTGVDGKRYCFGPYVTRDEWCPQYVPGSPPLPLGTLIMVGDPARATTYRLRSASRSPLILPAWWSTH
jgi:hypothetical protein